MMQIDVDIFEPQGIRKLDVQTSFLPKDLATQLIKKSFSGKEVSGMALGLGDSVGGPLGILLLEGPSLSWEACQASTGMREAGVFRLVSQGN